jgi:hypothetical protein
MSFRRFSERAAAVLILALAPWIFFFVAIGVHAQNLPPPGAYPPIPNFTGVGAGLQFRQAINDRFSGVQPIAPTIVSLTFANLPTELDGGLIYCNNCAKTNPCTGGGSGAYAMGQNGQWTCAVSGLSPTADINFNAHKASNLGSGTVNGDALAFGQVGAQLGAFVQPFVRPGSTLNFVSGGASSNTNNKPANTAQGDLLLYCVINGSSSAAPTVIPSGFTALPMVINGGKALSCLWKLASSSEPSSYTVTFAANGFIDGVLMDIANVAPGSPIDATNSSIASLSPYTIAAPVTTNSKDLIIIIGGESEPQTLNSPVGTLVLGPAGLDFTDVWSSLAAPATANISGGGGTAVGQQIAILPSSIQGAPALRDTATGFLSLVSTSSPNYSQLANPMTGFDVNNCVNPVSAAYGADPTGASDSSAALDAASLDACARGLPICLPAGTYSVCSQPWLHTCAGSSPTTSLPDIFGAGRRETVIQRCNTPRNSVMPVMVLAPAGVVTGGAGLAAPLVGSTGNSFNFSTGFPLFDLDEAMGNRALNGLAAFTAEGFFTTTTVSVSQMIFGSLGSATPVAVGCQQVASDGATMPTCKGAVEVFVNADGKLKARFRTGTTGWIGANSFTSASALSANTTYYWQFSYDGSNGRLYHAVPGSALTSDGKVAMTGAVSQRVDEDLVLGSDVEYWHLLTPAFDFQGKMDSVRLSNTARCTNDSGGCTAPNAKLAGDTNTLFLENWSNTNLPLVSPEWFSIVGTNSTFASTPRDQPWMTMRNFGFGNPGGNLPHIKDLSIFGGSFNLVADVTAPQLENIGFSGAQYGLMIDQINDYGASGRNLYGGAMAPNAAISMSVNGGLSPMYNLQFTCGAACIETDGPLISGAYFLPPPTTQWNIISPAWLHADSVSIDAENGGTYTAIEVPNMLQPTGPWLSVTNSTLSSYTSPVVTVDGLTQEGLGFYNSELAHVAGTGAEVDGTNGTVNGTVVFDNVGFENHLQVPPPGNTFVNGGLAYQVVGGGTRTQTTLNGTTAGTAVWSQPAMDSSVKKVVVFLSGYENTTTTAQTIAYPVAFTNTPKITADDSGGSTASRTALTLPASMSATKTGWVIVEGY